MAELDWVKAVFKGTSSRRGYQQGTTYTIATTRGHFRALAVQSEELPCDGIEYTNDVAMRRDWALVEAPAVVVEPPRPAQRAQPPMRRAAKVASVAKPARRAPAKPAVPKAEAALPALSTRVRQKAKAIVEKKEKAAKPKSTVSVSADYIRKLPVNHPERQAYTNAGVRGWDAYMRKEVANA
ncbi:hypothetical protein [Hymenobacter terricola]|uniref:hypothetical protein n=1 Tax=Hymenobacter terricola TaxID=2819236 RepID=UPI001B31403A|nr:hypothetical protein [Hymenobacter terricola]